MSKGPRSHTWPTSAAPGLEDLDLKRPGKVDPALRARVLRGAVEPSGAGRERGRGVRAEDAGTASGKHAEADTHASPCGPGGG